MHAEALLSCRSVVGGLKSQEESVECWASVDQVLIPWMLMKPLKTINELCVEAAESNYESWNCIQILFKLVLSSNSTQLKNWKNSSVDKPRLGLTKILLIFLPPSASSPMNTRNKFRQMWISTARKANRIAVSPIALPIWTKVLRLTPVAKMSPKDLLEVI